MIDSTETELNRARVNDTLFNLLSYEFPPREWSDKKANELLRYLIKIGLHESAYNLASGKYYEFEEVTWEQELDEISKELNETEDRNHFSPWFQDNIK